MVVLAFRSQIGSSAKASRGPQIERAERERERGRAMSDPNVPFVPARDTVQAHLEPEIRDGSQSRGGHIHTLVS